MNVLHYQFTGIEAEIVNSGMWDQVRIVQRSKCTSDPNRPDDLTEILRFGQFFMSTFHAEKFMKSKAFKAIFKAAQKDHAW